MIKKVYKSILVPKIRIEKVKVVNRVKKYRFEDVTINAKKGYCGRCGRYYNYGENKREPENCPRCICKDCGVSIKDRKRSISGYSHSVVDRCYSCWSLWYRGYRRGGIGYEVSYNHEKPQKGDIQRKRVEYEEEIIDYIDKEVEYSENKTVIHNIKPLAYDFNNRIYYNKINFDDIFKEKIVNITNNIINEDKYWYNCKSVDRELLFLSNTDPNTKKITLDERELKSFYFNDTIVSEKQTLEEFCDVVGFYPNVPAYIQGHPLCMYNNKRKNIINYEKSITIYVNLAVNSDIHYTQYKRRGIIVVSLIESLLNSKRDENETVKVNLKLLDATHVKGETIIQTIDIMHDKLVKKNNNNNAYNEINDIVYNLLTSISFFRVVMLDKKISFINKEKLSRDWSYGQGDIVRTQDLKKVMNLDYDDVLIGSVDETKTSGLYLDDDIIMFLKSIDKYNDFYMFETKKQLIEKGPEEVIKNRKIEKLIHVTNKENLESIKKYGLMPVSELENNKINYICNDNLRLDNHIDGVCLSVTNVNEYLFGSFQKRYRDSQYVVLEIDPNILIDPKIRKIYYDYNAASPRSAKSETNMEIMFPETNVKKLIEHTRRDKKINEPTSGQAEILFFGKIDPKYIIKEYDLGKINLK